jgi:alanyl-tRNA synthetase
MQQHTGQHILSAAFDREVSARTTSFHLGGDAATIDLDRELSPSQLGAGEQLANRVVWEDRPVTVRFTTAEEASRMPLRKEPARTGTLRLVDVTDFDLSACGGTHVARTGMIGVIAIAGWERFKGGSRVTFVCGGRALRSHGALRDATAASARLLSSSVAELPAAIARLQADVKASSRTIRDLQQEVAEQRATNFRDAAETLQGYRGVLRHEAGWDQSGLKTLASAVVSVPGFVTVLVGTGQPAPIVIARSADVAFDAARWMSTATAKFGGRGGGRPELAQGGVTAAPEEILAFARETI